MALPKFNTKQIQDKLTKIRRQEEEDKAKRTAKKFNLSYVNLTVTPIDYENLANIPRKKAEQGNIIVLQRKNRVISLALTDPNNPKTKEIIKELENKEFECKIFVVSPTSLKRGLGYYDIIEQHAKKRSLRSVFIIQKKELEEFKESLQTVQKLEKTINTLPTSRLLTIIMAGAIEMKASDIHIEPSKTIIRLRYRIDGLLQDIVDFPIKQYAFLLSKIKMLSDMLLNVHDISQDGRFSINILDNNEEIEQTIDLRVSVLPSSKGESVVIRLLGLSAVKLDIKELGVRLDLFNIIKNQISQPNGMILTTGPTGSGKTTTLYACLNYVNKPGKKIITVENPVEYQLKGITQTQISRRKGHTFGKALRSIVRQDPDILMIGEIRDEESAEIAIQFSLTGHLVFSTLHTNNATGAIPRLNGMGIDSPSLAAAINMVIAQRLVRKLCIHCKKEYQPTEEEIIIIKKIISSIPKKSGIKIPEKVTNLYKAEGCSKCHGLGYNGRIGIFELFVVSDGIKKIILERGADYQLQAKAEEEGMTTLMQNVMLKMVEGKTTLEEIKRVIGSPELSAKKILSKKKDKEISASSGMKEDKKREIKREIETEEIGRIKNKIQEKKLQLQKEETEKKEKALERRKKIMEEKEKSKEEKEKIEELEKNEIKKAEKKKAEKEAEEKIVKLQKETKRKIEEEELKAKKEKIIRDIMERNANRKKEAEEKAEKEAKMKKEIEERSRKEAEERLKKEKEEIAKKEAKMGKKVEEKARREAEEQEEQKEAEEKKEKAE